MFCSTKHWLATNMILHWNFVISRNFGARKDFSSREQDLPQQRWQKNLWVTPCPGIEGVPEEGEIGAASPCGVGESHLNSCLKKDVISFTKEGVFMVIPSECNWLERFCIKKTPYIVSALKSPVAQRSATFNNLICNSQEPQRSVNTSAEVRLSLWTVNSCNLYIR